MPVFLLAVALLAPPSIGAQPAGRVFRLGFISSSTTSVSSPFLVALRQGLSELGYVEGKNVTIEYRFAERRELMLADRVIQ